MDGKNSFFNYCTTIFCVSAVYGVCFDEEDVCGKQFMLRGEAISTPIYRLFFLRLN